MTCTTGNCELTQSPDYRLKKQMPMPTDEDMRNPLFDPIWNVLSGNRLECPEYYEGWQVATGCHVKIIIDQIKVVE